MNFDIDFKPQQGGWGFVPSVSNVKLGFADIQVTVHDSRTINWVVNKAVNKMKDSLPATITELVISKVNPLLANLSSKALKFPIPVANYTKNEYNITLNFTSIPWLKSTSKRMSFPINTEILNVHSGDRAPDFEADILPFSDAENQTDIEFIIGNNLINQIAWAVVDAKILNISISNNTLGDKSPISLDTSSLMLLIPGLAMKYGPNKLV